MNIPQAAVDIIKEFEGFRESTYLDSAGIPTIGYGTTAAAGLGIVPVPGMTISEKQAEQFLIKAIEKFANQIRPHIQRPMTDNQWSAFLSLAYNIGPGAFRRSSVLKFFNAGDEMRAADAFLMWNKAGGQVLRGLQRRRQRERTLFLTPDAKTPLRGFWAALWALVKRLLGKM